VWILGDYAVGDPALNRFFSLHVIALPLILVILVFLHIGNKNVDIKFSAHERFWNNLHQVAQDQKIGKPNNLIVLGAQNLWVLMLCKNFFYTW
jgi:hypothetical protein